MTSFPMVLLSKEAADRIEGWGASWGIFNARSSEAEGLLVVSGISRKEGMRLPAPSTWESGHFLHYADEIPGIGCWYRVNPELTELHRPVMNRDASLTVDGFKQHIIGGWRLPTADRSMPVLTYSADADRPARWSLWWVSQEEARPGSMELVAGRAPLDFLEGAWPVSDLAQRRAVVIGVGSIGAVVAESLASYAVGRIDLVDPDRLLEHNLVRHRLGARDLGRLKVNAMAEHLEARFPGVIVGRHPLNVVYAADQIRPLFAASDVVVGATDGVVSRRVINHLARRADVPAVLACVLESGALGEVVRVRPGAGCLLCLRTHLTEIGAVDPEPGLDQDYEMGTPHLPMTAVAGDLGLIGILAAKAAVATLLEQTGHWEQRLPGDVAVVGLQPVPDVAPPFDLERTGDVRWSPMVASRPDCPTCAAA